MRKRLKNLVSLILAASILLPGAVGRASEKGSIDVVILSCDVGDIPQATLQLGPTADGKAPPPERLIVKRESDYVYRAHAVVDGGVYAVFASNKSCAFGAAMIVGVASGEFRHVVGFMQRRGVVNLADLRFRTLMVEFPSKGGSIHLVARDGHTIYPKWDGDAAYFDGLQVGRYALEFNSIYAAACVPFNVPVGIDQRVFQMKLSFEQLASILRRAQSSGAAECPSLK